MSVNKITEKTTSSTVKDDAYFLLTQTEEVNNEDVHALRRVPFGTVSAAVCGDVLVPDMTALAASTADNVLVLHDDSDWGTGGPCWFEKSAAWSVGGHVRSDGTRVYPATSNLIPAANAPVRLIMAVIKSWVGRSNIIHTDAGTSDLTGLFAEDCEADGNGKFHMDCSDFVSSVLYGITYNNSRYVRGKADINIQNEILSNVKLPQSDFGSKTLGGLTTVELAQFFAEQGRLFSAGDDPEKLAKTLRFGDILFGSNDTRNPNRYFGIEHCAVVLGTARYGTNWFAVVAHCNSATESANEGTVCQTRLYLLNTLIGDYFKVFARPNYKEAQEPFSCIEPKTGGTYTYDCLWLPSTVNRLDDSAIELQQFAGHKGADNHWSSTYDYCPVIPGSTLSYTGVMHSSDNVGYIVRCHEYDENLNQVKRAISLVWNGEPLYDVTLDSTTKYVQFSIGFSASTNAKMKLNDTDDFEVTITPPASDVATVSETKEYLGIE